MTNKVKNYKLKIPSNTENLEIIRNFVSGIARKVGFKKDDIHKIELAVDEACTNVIQHAYKDKTKKPIDVAIKLDFEKLSIIITDRGEGFDFKEIDVPDMEEYLAELRVGGLGIYLMRTLMDEVDYKKSKGKNQVRMVKYLLDKDKKIEK
ncbi:MAG: ATP-binding protein [bacterium]